MTQLSRPILPGIEELLQGIRPTNSREDAYVPEHATAVSHRDVFRNGFVQPVTQGWFDVDQDEVRRSLQMIHERGLSRDDLYNIVFDVDESRPLYKDEKKGCVEETHMSDTPSAKHSACEKKRRLRHGVWQEAAHKMTPEIAHQAVGSDPIYLDGKSRKSGIKKASSQKPGKDEQLCSVIYTNSFLGLALQSEHQGRKQAEERAAAAESRLAWLEGRTRKRAFERDDDDDASSVTSLKRQRLHRPLYRLPPSPSLTASLSPSPTPTLSASASFSQ